MEKRVHWIALGLAVTLAASGCNKQSKGGSVGEKEANNEKPAAAPSAAQTPPPAAAQTPPPAAPAKAPAAPTPTTAAQEKSLPSGLKYVDLVEGTGDVAATGKTVIMHYTGWLTDGTKFDSSLDRGQPFPVPLGQRRVIPGWEQGIPGMKVGGKRKLIIPPDLAYGPKGFPGAIPPNATLIFEVELLGIR
jgi:FKBP-type peptidyl-prolyl cis-trans isomerase